MPTLPRPQGSRSAPEPHRQRQVAESFGADAARYDRARPSYPSALVDGIVAGSPGRDVLDVGCGTGIAARQFQAAGCTVLGVDPDPRMAELARQSGLSVDVTKFEDWEPAGRQFHAVIAAQAWHWVDPVAGAEKAAQALRPDGRLAVFWNAFEPPSELRTAFGEVYGRVKTGLPFDPWARPLLDAYLAGCAKTAAGIRQTGAFGEPEQWRFDWDRPYSRDEWLDLVPTIGGHSQIPPDRLAELLAGMGAAIDAFGGSFTMEYATVAVAAARMGTD
ncbi:MAG: methyltransferase domain-containing protein [Actinobacteria bacterium]|nr:methyltransferase domain-containing protein [Actinomycetota bacterium]